MSPKKNPMYIDSVALLSMILTVAHIDLLWGSIQGLPSVLPVSSPSRRRNR